MAGEFANKIKRLELENFTCFGKVAMDFSPGINVFIGENGTGKTHLLKVLYGLNFPLESGIHTYAEELYDINLDEIFKVEQVKMLSRESSKKAEGKIHWLDFYRDFTILPHDEKTEIEGVYWREMKGQNNSDAVSTAIYFPPQEMLSIYEGFAPSYEKRENKFDVTYYHLAKALAALPLKEKGLNGINTLLADIVNQTGIRVLRRGEKFFIKLKNENAFEATVSATGINKLAQLIYLIMNGSLTKDTILFWDEPEANLNPKYILVVSKFLQTLAKAGCQIFVATHDYLLPYDLSLSKEYQDVEGGAPDMKFFSLYKGENGTEVEEAATMPDLNHDPIHEGLSQHNSREDALFRKSLNPQA